MASRERVGLKLEPHQILIKPLVTEKGVHLASRHNQYAFEVHQGATKESIRAAVEELFDVRVDCVRTQNRKGKRRNFRFRKGSTSPWKKALVTLVGEDKIDFI